MAADEGSGRRAPNSTRFLAAFGRIESHLRRLVGAEVRVPFATLVREAARRQRWIERFAQDLAEYAELRNAIVHHFRAERAIAEPHDDVTERIEAIAIAVTRPTAVVPRFQRRVATVRPETPIGEAVVLMREEAISKLPVMTGEAITGLLTTGAIARWLGASVAEELVDLRETPVSEVLRHADDHEPYRIVSARTALAEAVSLFLKRQEEGRRLEAVLITERGRQGGQLVGLITTSDLPAAFRELFPENPGRERPEGSRHRGK